MFCLYLNGYSTPGHKVADDLGPFGLTDFYQMIQNQVGAVFVKGTVITEAEEVEFKGFALHAFFVGDVADGDFPEVRLPGDGADRGELGAVEGDDVVPVGMGVIESLQGRGLGGGGNLGLAGGKVS